MMESALSWWRARTERERVLLQVMTALVFFISIPLLLLHSAGAYRLRATSDLASSERLLTEVEAYAASRSRMALEGPAGDGTPRGEALAIAAGLQLTIARLEPAGPERWRVFFGPADSRALLQWVDRLARAGVETHAARMIRVGDADAVEGEFEIGPATVR